MFYETSNELIINCAQLTDLSGEIPEQISNKQEVYFHNVYVHGGNPTFKFENCGIVNIENCKFKDMKYKDITDESKIRGLFKFNNIDKVKFYQCKFEQIQVNKEFSFLPYVFVKPIGNFSNIEEICFQMTEFIDCCYLCTTIKGKEYKDIDRRMTDIPSYKNKDIRNVSELNCRFENSCKLFIDNPFSS